MSNELEVPDFLTHLMTMYQTTDIGIAGQPADKAPLDQLYESCQDDAERHCCQRAIQHFMNFAAGYLKEHPPTQQFMLAEGIGVELGGGIRVSIGPPAFEDAGQVDADDALPVTLPQSVRGQAGIVATPSHAITGTKPDTTTLRGPG